MDLNPLAVELCKVALWLEAHSPGEPLNFLDHHIKCGNAIVGFVRREELERGVPDEAFATLTGDDKDLAAHFRRKNKDERAGKSQIPLNLAPELQAQLDQILTRHREISNLPEKDPAEIEAKKRRYEQFASGPDAWHLAQLAAIPIAQFYTPKTEATKAHLLTDEAFRDYLAGKAAPRADALGAARALAERKRFFHWFLQFPEIIARGGFDCILGNPPYLWGQALSSSFGQSFCGYVKWAYAPAGLTDLVVYFLRRMGALVSSGGNIAFISTNSIKDGDNRRGGLDQLLLKGAEITMVVRGTQWPGVANLVVSLVCIHNGRWLGQRLIDARPAKQISSYFEEMSELETDPQDLRENEDRVFQGSILLGDGFLIEKGETEALLRKCKNKEVLLPFLNGDELNNLPQISPSKYAISFRDWSLAKAGEYPELLRILEERVKPERLKQKDAGGHEYWWRFLRPRPELYARISQLPACIVSTKTTKHLCFTRTQATATFSQSLNIFTTDRWEHFSILQSTLHEIWARKYTRTHVTRLAYSPTDCFANFPLPKDQWHTASAQLAAIGEHYHEHRSALMLRLWLGLTDIYNLFHDRDLTPAEVARVSKKPAEAEAGYESILQLRALHRELDEAVLAAYGWTGQVALGHDFHEVETLPENDRVRYTISPAARKELLRRLLALNHQRAAEEKAQAATTPKPAKNPRKPKSNPNDLGLQIEGELPLS